MKNGNTSKKQTMQRRCVGCGTGRNKTELIRIVRNSDGQIFLDLTGKQNGRGAYLCKDPACLECARKKKRLSGSFHQEVPDTVYDDLAAALEEFLHGE